MPLRAIDERVTQAASGPAYLQAPSVAVTTSDAEKAAVTVSPTGASRRASWSPSNCRASLPGCVPMSDVVVEAPVTQVVSGSTVADGETTPCAACGRHLRDGDPVVVYACRCVEPGRWRLPRSWCQACAPDALVTRTLGVVEAPVDGRLAVRTDAAAQQATAAVGEDCPAPAAATSEAGR